MKAFAILKVNGVQVGQITVSYPSELDAWLEVRGVDDPANLPDGFDLLVFWDDELADAMDEISERNTGG